MCVISLRRSQKRVLEVFSFKYYKQPTFHVLWVSGRVVKVLDFETRVVYLRGRGSIPFHAIYFFTMQLRFQLVQLVYMYYGL